MGLAERGVRRPPGWMGEEAFLRIAMRFLPGRQPRRAVARAVQWPIETVRTYRQTRILRFMSVPTSPAARLTTMAERVSLRRCGPATSLLSISSQLPTAIKRRASSTPVFMPLVADQATAAVFMTLTAGGKGHFGTKRKELAKKEEGRGGGKRGYLRVGGVYKKKK